MLTNHTIERIPLEPITRPHSFAIDTEEGTKVQLSADTEEAASRWIAIISHAAQQCDPWLENRCVQALPANLCIARITSNESFLKTVHGTYGSVRRVSANRTAAGR